MFLLINRMVTSTVIGIVANEVVTSGLVSH